MMNASVLFKVPLLVIEAFCTWRSTTPPNPTPPAEQRTRFLADSKAKGDFTVSRFWSPLPFRSFTYFAVLGEAFFILLTSLFPSSIRAPALFHLGTTLTPHQLRLSPYFLTGFLTMSTGTTIRMLCFHHMGRFFTFQLSVVEGHRLIKSGPYALVRHPGYLGSTLFYIGVCLSVLGPGSWLAESGLWGSAVGRVVGVVYVTYCTSIMWMLLSRVPKEDAVMKRQFGKEWEEWARDTPYKVVPFVY